MSYPVKLQCYDVSRGMARQISPMLLGRQLEGLWHTGISVYGNEYFFGGDGIAYCSPGGTILGPPTEVVDLGDTEIDQEMFHDYLESLAMNSYFPASYHLIDHNCNAFSAEVALFLTSRTIPEKITNLTTEIMNTPFGQMIRPFIESMQGPIQSGTPITHQQPSNAQTSTTTVVQSTTVVKTSESSKPSQQPTSCPSANNPPKNAPIPPKNPPKSDNKKQDEDLLDLD